MTDKTDDVKPDTDGNHPKTKPHTQAKSKPRPLALFLLLALIGSVLLVIIFGLIQSYGTPQNL